MTGKLRSSRGFTLIELTVVIAMIMILAGMAMAQYRHAVRLSQEAVLSEDLFRMRDAIDQYYADKGQYPADLATLVGEGYLRAVPKDPFTRSADSWQTVPSEPDPSNPAALPGIYNVMSGSEETGSDGRKYSEW